MRKKGFTLIELLAVIVILAIIALIATPIVMNVIENARKGAAERSAENYIDAVETAVGTERIDGKILEGEYTIQEDGNLCKTGTTCTDETEIKIEMNGNKPTGGTIIIENGQVVDKLTTDETKVTTMTTKENYKVSYNSEGKLEAVKNEDNEGSTEEPENTSITVYSWSKKTINLNQEIDPTDTTKFTTDPTTLGKDYYLKHVVENNIVKESYVCAKYADNKEPTCIRGGSADYYGYAEDPANYAGNVLILKGLQDEDFSCSFDALGASCNKDDYIHFYAYSFGGVNADAGGGYCSVGSDGSSTCEG